MSTLALPTLDEFAGGGGPGDTVPAWTGGISCAGLDIRRLCRFAAADSLQLTGHGRRGVAVARLDQSAGHGSRGEPSLKI